MVDCAIQSTAHNDIERIKAQLESVPLLPGVYLWKNKNGEVIYVGKAKQLRARMRQYVTFQDSRVKIPLLVEQIDSFEYLVVENEHEALILEKNLIEKYSPYFNADLKDDKSYPFICLTTCDMFPALKYTREQHRPDCKYFGPYTDSHAARAMVEIARKVSPICASTCEEWRRIKRELDKSAAGKSGAQRASGARKVEGGCDGWREDAQRILTKNAQNTKACFDFHVGRGPGACCGKCSAEDYAKSVARIERFLSGHYQEFLAELTRDMTAAAAELDFEKAARVKQRIEIVRSLTEKQHIVSSRPLYADVIGIFREETIAGVHLLIVREGRIVNSNEFILNKGKDVPDEDLLRMFMLRYYDAVTQIPREIITSLIPEDYEVLEAWLTEKLANPHGAKVSFVKPERGEKLSLLEMANKNAQHTLLRYKVRTNYDDERVNTALLQLESALALPAPPQRIECFDISTIHGSYTVASMVVFSAGIPDKSQYRRFKIKTPLDESNDFLCMQEVMQRRYCPEKMADTRFGAKPDLVILDGGKPQLHAAREMFVQMGIDDIALVGLAKRDEELFVTWQENDPVVLPSGTPSLYLVKQIRDEAHRFAITFHRELRQKGMASSLLDSVAGIGPKKKKALLKHFGSFAKLREATRSDIMSSNILSEDVANELYRVLAQYHASRVSQEITTEGESHEQ